MKGQIIAVVNQKGGKPCGARFARRCGVMTVLPKATHEKRQYPLSPGLRGKYGENASKQFSRAEKPSIV